MAVRGRKRKRRKLAAKYKRRRAMVVIVFIAIIVGVCYIIDALQRREESGLTGNISTASPVKNTPGSSQAVPSSAVNTATTIVPTSTPGGKTQGNATGTPAVNELDFSALLYFPDEDFSYLFKQSATLKYKGSASKVSDISTADRIKISVEALVKGPGNDTSRTFIPKGTKILDVKVNGKKAVINFSKEFKDNQASSSLSARMALGQILLTCGELNIDEVTIQIEGKIVEDYPGGADLSKPLKVSDYLNLKA